MYSLSGPYPTCSTAGSFGINIVVFKLVHSQESKPGLCAFVIQHFKPQYHSSEYKCDNLSKLVIKMIKRFGLVDTKKPFSLLCENYDKIVKP